jgi:transketolase
MEAQAINASTQLGLRTVPQISDLRRHAGWIRMQSLRAVHRAGLGHPGGDLSCADILTTLYFAVLRLNELDPADPLRDRFIMSKGHCTGALYATLAARGLVPAHELETYMQPLSRFNGHPDRNKVAWVEANTGPLGHGLPIAVGCALAAQIDDAPWRTFVLTGDGELQEGSNWEAAMAATQFRLHGLTVIVDRNRIQQGDFTENTIRMDPLAERWRAFGWATREIDGHSFDELLATFSALPFEPDRPSCILANTIKGKGVKEIENRPEWHHRIPTEAELQRALGELEKTYGL